MHGLGLSLPMGAAGASRIIPLAGTWDIGYWDSRNAASSSWVPREGSGSWGTGVAATISTSYYGGINTVLFNGSTQYFQADSLASAAAGSDVAITMAIDCHVVSVNTNDALLAFGRSDATAPYMILRTDSTDGSTWEVLRDGDTGANKTQAGGTTSTGVHRLIISFSGTAVTLWDNGTKIIDAQDLDTNTCTFDKLSLAARFLSSVGNHANIAARHVALRTGGISNTHAALLNGAWS